MARILLGVSGGIAAYKAVELVRLATGAGHAVRVVQTPASLNFVGRATFEGVTGAPVLVEEFERDPARGAYPGEPAPDHDPISHLELARRADVLLHRARLGQHDRQAGRRAGRQPAHQRCAGLQRAAGAGAGDEQPHVRAPRDAGEPGAAAHARRHDRGARERAAGLARRVGRGPAGRPGHRLRGARVARRQRRRAARRPARARDRRRHPRADRLGALRGQPLVGSHGARARGGGGAARRRGHADRRERGAARRRPGSARWRWRAPPSCWRPRAPSSPAPTCC